MSDARVAIITAAGSGIGAEIARTLSAGGYAVSILSSSGKGESLAKELGGLGATGSNRSVEDLGRLVDATLERWGRIDAVVNSAGHGPTGPILEITDEEWHDGLEVYFLNVVRMTRLVTPQMQAQRGGSIVNIATYATFEPEAPFPTSGVFRSSLAAFTKLYADEYAGVGIRMNNVLPGFVDSFPASEERLARIPMGRYGRTFEIAEVVAFLVSDRASYITGQNIRVDGGITRSV
jgi:NAD(P)-dependent dehydrogenase (short-subunit alcohol dehydrogenase family)